MMKMTGFEANYQARSRLSAWTRTEAAKLAASNFSPDEISTAWIDL